MNTQVVHERSLDSYNSTQWWFKELENIYVLPIGDSVTVDMKRAASVARNLLLAVEAERNTAAVLAARLLSRANTDLRGFTDKELSDRLDALYKALDLVTEQGALARADAVSFSAQLSSERKANDLLAQERDAFERRKSRAEYLLQTLELTAHLVKTQPVPPACPCTKDQ